MNDRYTITLPIFNSCLGSTNIKEVTQGSSSEEKKALEQFARYFKYEMHYDDIQYEANTHKTNCIGFLFYTNALDIVTDYHDSMPSRCYGGCTFTKFNDLWVLCWIWLHPYFRNRGHLSKHWKYFTDKFGDFAIETPLSSTMESFINKQNGTHKLVKIPSF